MNTEVLISVKGLFASADDGQDLEVITPGRYYERDGYRFLVYEEYGPDDAVPTRTLMKIDDGSVTVKKSGAVTSDMYFEQGRLFTSDYVTPYGTFEIGTDTSRLFIQQSEHDMCIEITYILSAAGTQMSECKVTIKVQEQI